VDEDLVGGLDHTTGRQRSFQPSMELPMAAMRSETLVKEPRRMAWRVMTRKDLKHVQPRCGRGRDVEDDSRVAGQPFADVGVFVGGVVVD
jgi:hypothetical protein